MGGSKVSNGISSGCGISSGIGSERNGTRFGSLFSLPAFSYCSCMWGIFPESYHLPSETRRAMEDPTATAPLGIQQKRASKNTIFVVFFVHSFFLRLEDIVLWSFRLLHFCGCCCFLLLLLQQLLFVVVCCCSVKLLVVAGSCGGGGGVATVVAVVVCCCCTCCC